MSNCDQCIIRRLNALKSLHSDELRSITKSKNEKVFNRGDYIFKEGKYLNGIYCISSGICKLVKSVEGKIRILKFIKQGDLLGLRSLMSNDSAKLSAIAMNRTKVCFIPKEEIINLTHQNYNFSDKITDAMCQDLLKSNDKVVELSTKNIENRLAAFLLEFEEDFGLDKNGFIKFKLSREELAGIVGTATESLIRKLSVFKNKNLLIMKEKKIKLINKKKLKEISLIT